MFTCLLRLQYMEIQQIINPFASPGGIQEQDIQWTDAVIWYIRKNRTKQQCLPNVFMKWRGKYRDPMFPVTLMDMFLASYHSPSFWNDLFVSDQDLSGILPLGIEGK